MAQLSTQLTFPQLLTKWSSILNPLLANPFNNITILPTVSLTTGVNNINHLLGRMQKGWIIIDIQGPATVYRSQPFNNTTLTLTSSANVTLTIGVF